jgi:hypothetical protein
MVDDDKELLKKLKSYFELKGYIIYLSVDGKDFSCAGYYPIGCEYATDGGNRIMS